MSTNMRSTAAALFLVCTCFSALTATANASRPLFTCRLPGGEVIHPGEAASNIPCSSVFHSSTCGSEKLLTCGCELGQWVNCVESPAEVPSTESGSTVTTDPQVGGGITTEKETGKTVEAVDSSTCRHRDEDFSPGRVVAYMGQDGVFQRCTCGLSGEWDCTALSSMSCNPVDSTVVLDQLIKNTGIHTTCECIAGEWKCDATGSSGNGINTKRGETGPSCIPGAQREKTTCNNEVCSTERCVCNADGQYVCQAVGNDRNPDGGIDTSGSLLGTCNFNGFQVPVGFEFETSHKTCICKTAGGEMDCELKEAKASCEYMGFTLPDGSRRSSSHTAADGGVTTETCLCNDGAWDCHTEVGPRR